MNTKQIFKVVIYRSGFAIKCGRELAFNSDGSVMFYYKQDEAIKVCEELNKDY